MTKYIEIGQIVNTFGVKGFVKVKPFTDDIEQFEKLQKVYIKNKQTENELKIQEVKYHKNMVLIKFEKIDNIEEAEKLRNSYLLRKRNENEKLEENTYYIVDLLGLEVYDDNNNLLGNLEDIFNTGSNDIYVVKNELGKQILIPAISEVVKNIDIQNRKITVHIINGLI